MDAVHESPQSPDSTMALPATLRLMDTPSEAEPVRFERPKAALQEPQAVHLEKAEVGADSLKHNMLLRRY